MACTLQINGMPVKLTGWRVSCWLRSPNAKLVAKLSTTLTNAAAGQYIMPVEPMDTSAWPEVRLKADVRYVDAAGRVMHTETFHLCVGEAQTDD